MSEIPRQNEPAEPAGEQEERKVTLEDLELQSGNEIEWRAKRWTIDYMDDEGDICIRRVGEIGEGERDYSWIIEPKSREELERRGVTFLPSGGEEEQVEIQSPPLSVLSPEEEDALLRLVEETPQVEIEGDRGKLKKFIFKDTEGEYSLELDASQETLKKIGFTFDQKVTVKVKGVAEYLTVCGVHENTFLVFRDSHGEPVSIKIPISKEDLVNNGIEFITEEQEGKDKKPLMEGEPRIKPIHEEAPKEEGKRRGTHPKDAKKEMFGRQIGKITNLERFKGEAMPFEERKNLEALITELQGDRTDYLIDQWFNEHQNEREESSFGQDMPSQKKLELFMARGGEEYLEKDGKWRQLASLAEDIRMSGGQLSYESTLLANFYLDDFFKKTAVELSQNPENAPLGARQDRISRTREALYTALYKKEVPYNEEEAKQLALDDSRIRQDYKKFLDELNADGLLQEKAEYAEQSSLTIAALEAQGYVVKPLREKGGILKLFKEETVGARYFKDGAEVYPSFGDFSGARKAFEKQKKEELSGTYLPEKIRELKINELSGLANINGEDFERLVKDQENSVLAKIIEIKERVRLKEEDPAEAKRYEEMSKDKGVNIKEGLKGVVEDWDEIGRYDEDSFDFERIFSRFGGAPEGDYASHITPECRQSLLKSREKGPFSWMFSVMKLIARLQQLTEIK